MAIDGIGVFEGSGIGVDVIILGGALTDIEGWGGGREKNNISIITAFANKIKRIINKTYLLRLSIQ